MLRLRRRVRHPVVRGRFLGGRSTLLDRPGRHFHHDRVEALGECRHRGSARGRQRLELADGLLDLRIAPAQLLHDVDTGRERPAAVQQVAKILNGEGEARRILPAHGSGGDLPLEVDHALVDDALQVAHTLVDRALQLAHALIDQTLEVAGTLVHGGLDLRQLLLHGGRGVGDGGELLIVGRHRAFELGQPLLGCRESSLLCRQTVDALAQILQGDPEGAGVVAELGDDAAQLRLGGSEIVRQLVLTLLQQFFPGGDVLHRGGVDPYQRLHLAAEPAEIRGEGRQAIL